MVQYRAEVRMLNTKRVYALKEFTVELKARGWFFRRTYGDGQEKGPYSSIASVALMIARELIREIKRRDEPHQLPQ